MQFLDSVKLQGGEELVKRFKAMNDEFKTTGVDAVATRVLQASLTYLQQSIRNLPTKTDEERQPDAPKGSGARWWHYKWPVGTAREKFAQSLYVVELGSKQSRYFAGARIASVGSSGTFYGRLIERGFTVSRYFNVKLKKPVEVPGRFILWRAFKRARPEMQQQAVIQFKELMEDLGKSKRNIPAL